MPSHESRIHSRGNQLELWAEPGASPMLGLRVLRRDGREAAFDLAALADSIRRAGWPGESLDGNTAHSLSHAVRLYLQQSPQPVSIDTIRETVEKLLLDMGYTLTARMYAGAFAPAVDDLSHRANTINMLDEALPLERAERFLAAAAAEAGLGRTEADAVVAHVLDQIHAAKIQRLTPGLLREWMRSELHTRGFAEQAARIARLSLPLSALHDAFAENDRPPALAPGDPESAALALAGRVSAAYVLGQLVPSTAGQAHLRGDIQIRGIGNFLRLDSAKLDLRRLPMDARSSPASPKNIAAQLTGRTDTLSRFFGGELTWPSVNFAFAPFVENLSDNELADLVHTLLSTIDAHAHTILGRASVQIGLAWDGPPPSAELLHTGDDHVSADAAYPAARRFLSAALEVLAEMSEQRRALPTATTGIVLSPYFFGAPDAEPLLSLLGRIAAGSVPIALHYDAAVPELFDDFATESVETVVAQTVVISVARAARLSSDLEDLLARLETRVESAAAAHRAKHDFLQRVYAERSGPLAALRSGPHDASLANPAKMLYRIAAKDAGAAALSRAGARWVGPGDALAVAEAVLSHLRDACTRHAAATGLRFTLADADATRSLTRAMPRHTVQPITTLDVECQLHSLYDEAPYFSVSGESFASPQEAAAFIRRAFLQTPCRALRIL